MTITISNAALAHNFEKSVLSTHMHKVTFCSVSVVLMTESLCLQSWGLGTIMEYEGRQVFVCVVCSIHFPGAV